MIAKELQELRRDEAFQHSPRPMAVWDEEFVIRAANAAYLELTAQTEDALLSRVLFEVYPENPDDPENDGPAAIRRSSLAALSEGRTHHLLLQRYDIPDPAHPGTFLPRWWAPMNEPLLIDGVPAAVVNHVVRVQDPTPHAVRTVDRLKAALGGGCFLDDLSRDPRFEELLTVVQGLSTLGREVDQLQEALLSRATIDQAKGIIMASRHCSPDEAFRVLTKLSNDTNVRLAEVARAVVYQAEHPRGAPGG
ncbi:ANTAR domain-containing protein [Nocardioides sp. 616]|uniref:ANTAR domain-containing protein n=1 Tax=Nocardioides sp. 616 TaxID=2268090 RepID=UPI0013B4687F|nr:ANTAR domain-containing protein [Nocardioides sp. 616]